LFRFRIVHSSLAVGFYHLSRTARLTPKGAAVSGVLQKKEAFATTGRKALRF